MGRRVRELAVTPMSLPECPEKHPYQGEKNGSKEDTGAYEIIVGSFNCYRKIQCQCLHCVMYQMWADAGELGGCGGAVSWRTFLWERHREYKAYWNEPGRYSWRVKGASGWNKSLVKPQ